MKYKLLAVVLLIGSVLVGCAVDVVFDNANSQVPYRIPAIAKNRNGDLIGVADYRYSGADIGVVKNGKLDIRYRIMDADTGEWGDVMTLAAAFGEGDGNIAFGDPCIVADRESDMVMVTTCSGNVSFQGGTHDNHQGWARFYSEDGGKTWSGFEDISDQVFRQLDGHVDGPIRCFFIGSGKITQSRLIRPGDYYRLYCAALVRLNNGDYVNYVFYSDDFGKKWHLLGDVSDCPIPPGGDEPKTEELPDGSVLISSRIPGGRYFNVFHFSDIEKGEGKWDTVARSDESVGGITASENACNGEVMLVPVEDMQTGGHTYLLLQSVPFGPKDRSHVGINYKVLDTYDDYHSAEDVAKNWDGKYQVTDLSSAYSTMTLDKDGNVAFFYEENGYNGGYDMVYRSISIPEITSGRYKAYGF